MGLVTPVELPSPTELGAVHFIAIGGSGMNGIASIMLGQGIPVSGSDRQDSKYLRSLEAQGARVYVGHRAEQLGNARTVVASSAIREDNPELAEARRRGLRVLHRSAALGSLMLGRRGIAVAGTHGKTTTTAMIAHVLSGCGFDPSFVIGGAMTGTATGGHLGNGDIMIIEADESDGSFLQYPREVAVVTNIDPDHLSNWGSAENYADGFLSFATANSVRLLVTSADDPGAIALAERVRQRSAAGLDAPDVMSFGTSGDADVRIVGASLAGTGSTFELSCGRHVGPVELSVPGHYNMLNAAAAYAVAVWLGAGEAEVRGELSRYQGTYRRFQLIGTQIVNRTGSGQLEAAVLRDPSQRTMVEQLLGQAYLAAHHLVEANKEAVGRIADELVLRRELYGDEILQLLDAQDLRVPEVDLTKDEAWPRL